MLRARKPEAVTKRLKLFMFGPAGVGKTTAAIQFPNSYIIDGERGTENYDKVIAESQSVVFQTTSLDEVIVEVKSLLTEKHDRRTLVIDPITPIYNDLLDKGAEAVGEDFGRHYGWANKQMKRLANLLTNLDMNVIVTAHAKAEYGDNMRRIGWTFDGWRQLDYWFDLVVQLRRDKDDKGKRLARVTKTRIPEAFPDQSVFEWGYEQIRRRYNQVQLERSALPLALALPAQVRQIQDLLQVVRLPEGTVDKWFGRAGVDRWEDLPRETIVKCIQYVNERLPQRAA